MKPYTGKELRKIFTTLAIFCLCLAAGVLLSLFCGQKEDSAAAAAESREAVSEFTEAVPEILLL